MSELLDKLSMVPVSAVVSFVLLCVALLMLNNFTRYRNIITSYRRLNRLACYKTPQEQFGYLRYTDPFVFEEMILSSLKRRGHKIRRNKHYVGDGGIDGQCWIDGVHFLIQAKRYKSHINAAHVEAFRLLCKERGARGLFIHTGRTGARSWDQLSDGIVDIVSGGRMLAFLSGDHFTVSQ